MTRTRARGRQNAKHLIGKLPHATQADLGRAFSSAQRAFDSWRKSSPLERSKVLRKVAELGPRARRTETFDSYLNTKFVTQFN